MHSFTAIIHLTSHLFEVFLVILFLILSRNPLAIVFGQLNFVLDAVEMSVAEVISVNAGLPVSAKPFKTLKLARVIS